MSDFRLHQSHSVRKWEEVCTTALQVCTSHSQHTTVPSTHTNTHTPVSHSFRLVGEATRSSKVTHEFSTSMSSGTERMASLTTLFLHPPAHGQINRARQGPLSSPLVPSLALPHRCQCLVPGLRLRNPLLWRSRTGIGGRAAMYRLSRPKPQPHSLRSSGLDS
jgi:hypothetical protein